MYFVAFAGVCVGLVIYSGYVAFILFGVSFSFSWLVNEPAKSE